MLVTVTTFEAKDIKALNYYTKKLNNSKLSYTVYGSGSFTIEVMASEERVVEALFS